MPSSYVFTGAGLYVLDASPSGASRVRLRFSTPPVRSNPSVLIDALRAPNYTLSGANPVTVTSVLPLSDPQSVELVTSAPLSFGLWTVNVANVEAPGGVGLSSPTSADFTVAQQQTSLTAGTENEGDAFNVIRKHLNAALDGLNWRAIIAALSDADNYIWDLARKAFDQLFLASASGKYLDRLANNDGNVRPVGMSDESFRPLAIELSTGRVTYLSILRILEAFYGSEALRAHIDTSDAPFSLVDGDTVEFVFEGRVFSCVLRESSFRSIGDATASELATVFAQFFEQNNLEAIAAVLVNPATGEEFVRVYSEVVGLRSSVAVTGPVALGFEGGTKTIYNGSRTVSVSHTTDGALDVSVPATANVERNANNAGYVYGNDPIAVRDVQKTDTLVSIETEQPHGLSDGQWVEISGFQPTPHREWSDFTGIGGGHQTAMYTTSTNSAASAWGGVYARLGDGSLFLAGGNGSTDSFVVTHTVSPTTGSGLADGSPSFVLTATPGPATPSDLVGGAHSVMTGSADTEVLFSGGYGGTSAPRATLVKLNSVGALGTVKMAYSRIYHRQVTLNDGKALIAGGIGGLGDTATGALVGDTSLSAVEIFDPIFESIETVSPMLQPRSEMTLALLPDGKVLAAGGFVHGQETPNTLPGLVGHWRFDSTTGTETPPVSGPFAIQTTLPLAHGKVNQCLDFGPTGGSAYTDHATIRNTVNLSNAGATSAMSIDFWLYMDSLGSGSDPISLLYLQDPVTGEGPLELYYRADASNLTFSYWYSGIQSTPIVCTPPDMYDKWNHICITGEAQGGDAFYKIYVNGAKVGETSIPEPVPSIGSERFALGYDPNGIHPTPFTGKIDDLRVWDKALNPSEVTMQYLRGAGHLNTHTRYIPIPFQTWTTPRLPLASCEVYDPDMDTWTEVPQMSSYRGGHSTVTLPNGEIMVIGGNGFHHMVGQPTGNLDWPLYRLDTTEIFNPEANEWRLGPRLPKPVAHGWAVVAGNYVYCGDIRHGYDWDGTNFAPATYNPVVYWLDTSKMDKWNVLAVNHYRTSPTDGNVWAVANDDFVLLGGGDPNPRGLDVIAPAGHPISATGGINGFRRVSSVSSPTSFVVESDRSGRANLHGDANAILGFNGTKFAFTNAQYPITKSGGTATVTAAIPEDTYGVWVGSSDPSFESGWKVITGRTDTTFQYAEVGTATGNLDWIGQANDLAHMPVTEAVAASGGGGTYILNPSGFTTLDFDTQTLSELQAGVAVPVLSVASTVLLPASGHVVLAFGTKNETKPIKYLAKISSTELLLESSFEPISTLPPQTTVTLIRLNSTTDIASSLWVTGSLLAVMAAKKAVEESVANDVQLNFNISYPGDRGLGGEGTDTSDKFIVWGVDTFEDPE